MDPEVTNPVNSRDLLTYPIVKNRKYVFHFSYLVIIVIFVTLLYRKYKYYTFITHLSRNITIYNYLIIYKYI